MKNKLSILLVLGLLMLLCMAFIGCDESENDSNVSEQTIYCDGISLSSDNLSLIEGECVMLATTIIPENASDKNITWTSSNESVALVVEGKVMAMGEGMALITATASNGKTATCTVTVKSIAVLLADFEYLETPSGYEIIGVKVKSKTSYTIPNCVTCIGDGAFKGCSVENITIPNSVTNIGKCAFEACYYLNSITIPDSVISIGESAFDNCHKLTSIVIPDSVTSIGDSVFKDCWRLESITIPASVTSIGDSIFEYCNSLTSITVANGNKTYHSKGNCIIETSTKTLIAGCKNSTVPTDGSVKNIGYRAFNGCTYLTSITIPESVTRIEDWAFSGCGLTSVTIGNNVTEIGKWAFSGCDFVKIMIPNSVRVIDDCAFMYCSNLTDIKFNGTKAQWRKVTLGTGWIPAKYIGNGMYVSGEYVTCTDGTVEVQ